MVRSARVRRPGSRSVLERIRRPAVFCLLALMTCLTTAVQAVPLEVIPTSVPPGAEIQFVVDEQPPSVSLQLWFRGVGELPMAQFSVDDRGQHVGIATIPLDLAPGDYWIDLGSFANVLASVPIQIVSPLELTLTPQVAVAGETIAIDVAGLTPGTLKVWVDDVIRIGPVAVGNSYAGEFLLPGGAAGPVWVIVENHVGRLLVGRSEMTLERYDGGTTVPSDLVLNRPPPLAPGETATLTGSVRVPAGTFARDFDWTLAWETQSGALFPVNITPVEFEPQALPGGVVPFSTLMVAPGLRSGFARAGFGELDKLGFVYQNPKTGSQGFLQVFGTNGYDDYDGIVITGRVVTPVDGNPIPLEDVIFSVTAETDLKDPGEIANQSASFAVTAAASSSTTSGIAAIVHGNNQITTSYPELSLSPMGCPITLYNGRTDANGEYQVAFSPRWTEFLNAVTNIPPPDINTPVGPGNFRDQFRIRLSGLHLGYGWPQPGSEAWTGIVYEFQRDPDAGSYSFYSPVTGEFDDFFNPNTVLVSTLKPVDDSGPLVLPSNPYIAGMAPPNFKVTVPVIGKLWTYPEYETTLAARLTEIRLPWLVDTNGDLDAILKIDGVTVGNLATADGGRCAAEGVDYSIKVPGLATKPNNPIRGRIEAGSPAGNWVKDFEIATEHGPTWFQDTASYSGHTLTWNPNKLNVVATEQDKKQEVNASNVGGDEDLGIGDMNNNNDEDATIYQRYLGSVIVSKQRVASTSTMVSGNSGGGVSNSMRLPITGPTTFSWVEEIGLATPFAALSNSRDELYARLTHPDWGAPDIGTGSPQTIIDTGRIPIFRYAWGIPPIAGATLGADIWFKVLMWYFGYLDITGPKVDLDMIVEPQTQVGLDVFFDFSALFGLVNAAVTASPAFGVGMPIVIWNNVLDTNASKPCFEFVLDIAFEVAVGICPVCVEASHAENLVSESTPTGCTVFAGPTSLAQSKASAAITIPPADAIGLSANDAGTAFLVSAEIDGIHATKLVGGVESDEFLIPSVPGASRPDVVFYDLNRAVAVWSKSALTEAQFAELVAADYTGPNTGNFNGTVDQHMFFSFWDGTKWSPADQLTPPNTGEGGVKLAACRAGAPGCPANGEVLVVWHRDLAGDIDQGQIRLYYAFFTGGTWSAPQPLDPTGTAKDVQPAPFYLDGEPGVVWVRNPSAHAQDPGSGSQGLGERQLAYRFLREPAGIQVLPDLSRRVASPSADAFADGTLAVAFTSSAENAPFIGSRRALWVATASSCSGGVCEWGSYVQRDQHNRLIYAEQPVLVAAGNRAIVSFRQLGVSGDLRPDDPVGLQGFGELVKIEFTIPQMELGEQVFAQALTVDGAVNWQTAAAFDPSTNSLLLANTRGAGVAQSRMVKSSARPAAGLVSQDLSGTSGIVAYSLPHLPDLAVTGIAAADELLVANSTLNVTVEVANLAAPMSGVLGLWWDGPPGVGTTAAPAKTFTTAGGAFTEVAFELTIPSGFGPDETHRLVAVVNPDRTIEEGDFSNNTREVTLNQMPTPQNVLPSVDFDGTLVILDWDPATDSRVTAWRIYRRNTVTLEMFSVGFTPVNGFVDLNVVPGAEYEYRIAGVTDGLLESEPTEWLRVQVRKTAGEMIFADGFE